MQLSNLLLLKQAWNRKYSSYKRTDITLLSILTPDPTDPLPMMLATVLTVSLLPSTVTDSAPETITHPSSIMIMIQSPAMNIVLLLLFIKDAMNGMTMTDVTGITLHHTHPISMPGMVIITTTLTDTDTVLVQLCREIEIQDHTLKPVFASGLLKDIHTLPPAIRETFSSCYWGANISYCIRAPGWSPGAWNLNAR